MVPVITPQLNDEKFTSQGRPVARSVQIKSTRGARNRPSGLVHVWKPTVEIDPACEPGSLLPVLSMPRALNDWHVNNWRVLVSLKSASLNWP